MLLLLILGLSNCDAPPPPSNNAPAENCFITTDNSENCFTINYREISGMRYAFILNYEGGSIDLNLTKDSLECALMRKQLEKQ